MPNVINSNQFDTDKFISETAILKQKYN